jgi:hypothetical protein
MIENDTETTLTGTLYRVGHHQPRNVYRGDEYIGVMFSPEDAAKVVAALNRAEGQP